MVCHSHCYTFFFCLLVDHKFPYPFHHFYIMNLPLIPLWGLYAVFGWFENEVENFKFSCFDRKENEEKIVPFYSITSQNGEESCPLLFTLTP